MKILILAGGSGKRLFPLTDPPKQFRCFGSPYSLLQKTLLRFLKRYPPKDIYIITSRNYEAITRSQCAAITPYLSEQLIVEPEPKNTAPAIAFALETLGGDLGSNFLVVPSDHHLSPEGHFLDCLSFVKDQKFHVLFGVTPTHPHEGYGYIECDSHLPLSRVCSFHEKPDQSSAEILIDKGCLWNTGMVLFHTQTLKEQLQGEIPSTSIDYFLLEKAENLRMMHLDLTWSDLGSWEGIYSTLKKDEKGNVIFGDVKTADIQHCLIIGGKEPIFLSGYQNCAVIISDASEKIVMPLGAHFPCQL